MKHLALALCLLAALACAKPSAPPPAKAAPPVLAQYKPLAALYAEFQNFRDDELYLRHGFTANFPRADWLSRVQTLEHDPDLADGAHLLANLAIARRIHGNGSRITRDFETRFDRTLRGLPPEEEQEAPAAPVAQTDVSPPAPVPAAELSATPLQAQTQPSADAEPQQAPQAQPASQPDPETQPLPALQAVAQTETPAGNQTLELAKPEDHTGTLTVGQAETPPEVRTEELAEDQPATSTDVHTEALTDERAATSTEEQPGDLSKTQPAPLTPALIETQAAAQAETQTGGLPESQAQASTPFPTQTQSENATRSEAATPAQQPVLAQPAPLPDTQPRPQGQTPAPSMQPAEVAAPGLKRSEIQTQAQVPGVTILFSGDTQGVLYPQPGLSGVMGGIASRGPVIERMRAEDPNAILVDAGDAFTSGFPKAARINRVLVQAMNRMGYDAMGLGGHDLAMGEVALRELVSIASFPLVCTNLRFQQGVTPWIRDHVILERGGVRVAVVSLLPDESAVRVTGASLIPARQALRDILPRLLAGADCILLLTQLDSARVAALPETRPAINAVIGDCRGTAMDDPVYLPTVPKGLGIGLLRLERADQGPYRPTRSLPLLTGKTETPELVRLLELLND